MLIVAPFLTIRYADRYSDPHRCGIAHPLNTTTTFPGWTNFGILPGKNRYPYMPEPRVLNVVHDRFAYCFTDRPQPGVAQLSLHAIDGLSTFSLFDIDVIPIRVWHSHLPIIGFRLGAFAYITDMLTIDETEYSKLASLDTLVVNALRHKPHLSHQNLESALAFISRIAPTRAYLTHMSHQMGLYAVEEPKLPTKVSFAYDGLIIEIPD